jgi:hypothetical protein
MTSQNVRGYPPLILASQLSTSAANDRKHPHRPIDPFLPNINILPIINTVVMIKVMLGDFFIFKKGSVLMLREVRQQGKANRVESVGEKVWWLWFAKNLAHMY